jgi:hypothetical protein
MSYLIRVLTFSFVVSFFSYLHGQESIQHVAVKKKEQHFFSYVEQPQFKNFDGSFLLILKPGIDWIDATTTEDFIRTSKSVEYFFTAEFLEFVELNRLDERNNRIPINNNLELEIKSSIETHRNQLPFVIEH